MTRGRVALTADVRHHTDRRQGQCSDAEAGDILKAVARWVTAQPSTAQPLTTCKRDMRRCSSLYHFDDVTVVLAVFNSHIGTATQSTDDEQRKS